MMLPPTNSNSRSFCRRFGMAMACALIASTLSTLAVASGGGEGGNKKKSVFSGALTLQLHPMWVPTINKHKKGTPPRYTPVSISITSYDTSAEAMCYKVPYLTQAFLFALNAVDLKIGRDRKIDVSGLNSMLLNEAVKVGGKHMVHTVKIISETPLPTSSNQDMLKLCQ